MFFSKELKYTLNVTNPKICIYIFIYREEHKCASEIYRISLYLYFISMCTLLRGGICHYVLPNYMYNQLQTHLCWCLFRNHPNICLFVFSQLPFMSVLYVYTVCLGYSINVVNRHTNGKFD